MAQSATLAAGSAVQRAGSSAGAGDSVTVYDATGSAMARPGATGGVARAISASTGAAQQAPGSTASAAQTRANGVGSAAVNTRVVAAAKTDDISLPVYIEPDDPTLIEVARDNPLTPQRAANLAPLRLSHDADEVEAGLKAVFTELFERYVRPAERETSTLGMLHIGSRDQFERGVKHEGLALYRRDDDGAMRYVWEAWRAGNPKRGLAMLQTYLQLLWPNAWDCRQMWQDVDEPYPMALSSQDGGRHFLTSRVEVDLSSAETADGDVSQVVPALRSVVPARILLHIQVLTQIRLGISVATALHGTEVQYFEGVMGGQEAEFVEPAWMAAAGTGAEVQYFEGQAH